MYNLNGDVLLSIVINLSNIILSVRFLKYIPCSKHIKKLALSIANEENIDFNTFNYTGMAKKVKS